MSKQVQINVKIDQDGVIHAMPDGTEGTECVDLMGFLDKIEGFTTVETIKTKDFKTKKVQINSVQKIGK
jgi:predicted homoserine dehydrogenase-like protein